MIYKIIYVVFRSCLFKGWNFGFFVCREVFLGVLDIRLEVVDFGLE